MSKDTGGPAFPNAHVGSDAQLGPGMTLRQYAAIKLRVPDSGCDWLDAMIEKASRDDFAAKAMPFCAAGDAEVKARQAYAMADAMLKERAK